MGICFSTKTNIKKPNNQRTQHYQKDNRVKMVKIEGIRRKVATLNI